MEDFHSMSRRNLQALCKQHHIPANSTNAVLVDRLTALLSKEREDPRPLGPSCLKGSGGSGSGGGSVSGGGLGDGYRTRSKRKRVTFQLPEGNPDSEGGSGGNGPVGKNSPEPVVSVPVARTTRSHSLRLQEDASTCVPPFDSGNTRRGRGAKALGHDNADKGNSNAAKEDSSDGPVDEGLVVGRRSLRHRVVVAVVDQVLRRGQKQSERAVAAVAPNSMPLHVPPVDSEMGGRRGSRKRRQDPVLGVHASSQAPRSEPVVERVAQDEVDNGGPRRSKRNHRNAEGVMAGRGASEVSAFENLDVGVEMDKERAAQVLKCQRPSRRKSVMFWNEEQQDGDHRGAVRKIVQRDTRNNASDMADEESSAPTGESGNCDGPLEVSKKSERVTQGGEPLRRSRRNALNRNKLAHEESSAPTGESGNCDGPLEVSKKSERVTQGGEPLRRSRRNALNRNKLHEESSAPTGESGNCDGPLEVSKKSERVTQGGEPLRRSRRNALNRNKLHEESSAPTGESGNCDGPLEVSEKSERVTQGGEPLRRSRRNALNRNKLAHDALLAEGGKSEYDDGKVARATLPSNPKIQTVKRRAVVARETEKITGNLEVLENLTEVSDYGEPSRRKRSKSVKCDVTEQKVSLPAVEEQGDDGNPVKNRCFRETRSQRLVKKAPKIIPLSDKTKTSKGIEAQENVEEFVELSQLGEPPKELKDQSSKDASGLTKQGKMADDLVQNSKSDGLCPTELFLETNVPLETSKTGDEPDKGGIQHEDDSSKEDVEKFEFQNFKEDCQVSNRWSPVVNYKSHDLCDQGQTENLPILPLSITKDTVEHSDTTREGSMRKPCDRKAQSSFKGGSMKKAPHGYQSFEESGGPKGQPDSSKLEVHVIDDSDAKTSIGLTEVHSFPDIHGLSSVSATYNQGCNLTLETTPMSDDETLSLPDILEEGRCADVIKSASTHDQGSEPHDESLSILLMSSNEKIPGEEIAAALGTDLLGKKYKASQSLVQNSNGGSYPTELFLKTNVLLEKSKTDGEPDKRAIQHEKDSSKKDAENFEFQSFKEDCQVSNIGYSAVKNKSSDLYDLVQVNLPVLSPSIIKDTVEHLHTTREGLARKHCDRKAQSSFKAISMKKDLHDYQSFEESGGPNEEPDCTKLVEHVIDDSEAKTSTGITEQQSSPDINALLSVSATYNEDLSLTLEITPVEDDEAISLLDIWEERVCADATESAAVHDQGSEWDDDSLSCPLMKGGDEKVDEKVPGKVVAATLLGTWPLEKECESLGSGGFHRNGHQVDLAGADGPPAADAISNTSMMGLQLTCEVAVKENIEVHLEGSCNGQSLSSTGDSEKSAELLDMRAGRLTSEEPSSGLRRDSSCDIAAQEVTASLSACRSVFRASTPTCCRHTVSFGEGDVCTQPRPFVPDNARGDFAEDRSGLKRLEGSLVTDMGDKCVPKEIIETLTGEESTMKFSDILQLTAEKNPSLNEHKETKEASADVFDEVMLLNETAQKKKNIEEEGAASSCRSWESSLNTHSKRRSLNSHAGVEATADSHNGVMLGNKVANQIVNTGVMEGGEEDSNWAVKLVRQKEIVMRQNGGHDRETELDNEKLFVPEAAEDGTLATSPVKDPKSEGQYSVIMPLHSPAGEKGIKSADEQETESSTEQLDAAAAGQTDKKHSSYEGINSELHAVSSGLSGASIPIYQSVCEAYNVADNRCLVGDIIVENQLAFPNKTVEEFVEDRTATADLVVNISIDSEATHVLNESDELLTGNQTVHNKVFSDNNEYDSSNAEETGILDSYETTEKNCEVRLDEDRESVELTKDALDSEEKLGTEVGWGMENTAAEGETTCSNTPSLEKKKEITGVQLGDSHPLSTVKTSKVEDIAETNWKGIETTDKLVEETDSDDQCAIRADGSSFQDVKLYEESIMLSIGSSDGANMDSCAISPEIEIDVCVLEVLQPHLSSDGKENNKSLELKHQQLLSLVGDVNPEAFFQSSITEKLYPDSSRIKSGLPTEDDTIEHSSSYETSSEVLQTESSVDGHDFIDHAENEKEEDKPNKGVPVHDSCREPCSEVLMTNLISVHDCVGHCENEKEGDKSNRDVSEQELSSEEKDKPNRDVSQHNSSYESCSEVFRIETSIGGHCSLGHCESDKEDDKSNRDVSEQELNSKEKNLKEKENIADEEQKVGVPKGPRMVVHKVDRLREENLEKKSRYKWQREDCEAMNSVAENSCMDHEEFEQEENKLNFGPAKEKLDQEAEYKCLLEQNEETLGGVAVFFEPETLISESWRGRFDRSLEHYAGNDVTIIGEHLDHNKIEDGLSNKRDFPSDHDYFAHIEGPVFQSIEGIQIPLREKPDFEANLQQVQGSWDLQNTVKDISHEEAGKAQDKETTEIQIKSEILGQREDLDYFTGFYSSYYQDPKDEPTYRMTEDVGEELYSAEGNNLKETLNLEATMNASREQEEYVGPESDEFRAFATCVIEKQDQGGSISKLTEPYSRGHQSEGVDKFCRNTKNVGEMHPLDMVTDTNNDEVKVQLASPEEFVVNADLDARSNVGDREQTPFPMSSTSMKFLEDCDSLYDKPPNFGKAEDGPLVNHHECEEHLDRRKQPSNLDFAFEVCSEGALEPLVKNIALDKGYGGDNHGSEKEKIAVVANDTNIQNLQNMEEENRFSERDLTVSSAFASSGYSSCQDTVGGLAGEEEISDILNDMHISSAKKHMITTRINCTPKRSHISKDFLHVENMKENTSHSKMLHATNVDKSAIPTLKRRALVDLRNRIH